MNLRNILFSVVLLSVSYGWAQNPKWFKKARKAQITIATYDKEGNLLRSGNGFYIDTQGTALANFTLFDKASKAIVVDASGKEFPVECIMGANSLYDVVKFRVKTEKKTESLTLASSNASENEVVYILPYPTKKAEKCTQDTIHSVSLFDEKYAYYTLKDENKKENSEQITNCPVMNEEGEILAMMQTPAASNTEKKSYAISVLYGKSLQINALSATSTMLQSIFIQKDIPESEDQALAFMYMVAAKEDSASYLQYAINFLKKFPQSINGYLLRANFYAAHKAYKETSLDITNALKLNNKQDEVHYELSKIIYQYCLYDKKEVEYKEWTLEKALAEAETAYQLNPLPVYMQQQGHCFYAMKQYEKAYEKYIALSNTNLRSAEIFLFAAQCKKMQGADKKEIIALQDSAVNQYTKPYVKEASTALMARANTYLGAEMYREAVMDLNSYEHLMRNEVNANFYYQKAQAEEKCRMYQQAFDDIDRAIRMDPQDPFFHLQKGILHYRINETSEAITATERAIALAPKFGDAYRILGLCLFQMNKKKEGLEKIQKAIDLGDKNAKELFEKLSKEL